MDKTHDSSCPIISKHSLCVGSSCHNIKHGPGNCAILSGPHWGFLEWSHRSPVKDWDFESRRRSKRACFYLYMGCGFLSLCGGWKEKKRVKQEQKESSRPKNNHNVADATHILSTFLSSVYKSRLFPKVPSPPGSHAYWSQREIICLTFINRQVHENIQYWCSSIMTLNVSIASPTD